jgi:hypothetical protein
MRISSEVERSLALFLESNPTINNKQIHPRETDPKANALDESRCVLLGGSPAEKLPLRYYSL